MAKKNFYVVLGISPDATPETIQDAYRALAKRYHPDGGSGDDALFREIAQAYEVLSHPTRRRLHDQQLGLSRRAAPPAPVVLVFHPPPEPLASEPVSVRRAFRMSLPSAEEAFVDWTLRHLADIGVPKSGRLEALGLEVVLTSDEAEHGGVLPIELPATTLRLRIPPRIADGSIWDLPLIGLGIHLRVHLRVASW